MSGRSRTRTTETRNEQRGVADWLQPYMQDIAPRAQALLANPTQQYQGPLVAPFSSESESGLRGLMQYAGQGVPGLEQGYGAAERAMSGFDPGRAAMMNVAYGGGNPMAGNIQAPMVNAQFTPGQTQATELRGIAQGVNPYLDPTFERAAEQVRNQVAATMSRAGMSGSGAQQDLLQRGLGDIATQIYGGAYEADQARRMAAAGQLAGLEQSDLARGLQAQGMGADVQQANAARIMQQQGMLADIFGQDLSRQLQAGGALSDAERASAGMGLQGAGALEQLYGLGRQPFQDQLRVGAARDEMSQRLIDAERQRFEQGQMLPWQDLARYQALINPLGQTFGTGSMTGTTTQTQSQSPLQSILGAAMMASSLFGNPFGASMGMGAASMGAPALLGAGTPLASTAMSSFPMTGNIGIPSIVPRVRI